MYELIRSLVMSTCLSWVMPSFWKNCSALISSTGRPSKALRAEIDEGAWSQLYSATSQPFDPPTTGKIAVRVINHFGDEVLKVYPVPPAKPDPR